MKIEAARNCLLCPLGQSRKHIVFGEGNPRARIFLIPQAPGKQEDATGQIFVGPTGEVFWELLEQADADREQLYISNLLKCRLPQNRRPKQAEIQACAPYLEQELAAVLPMIVAPLGYFATKYIFESRLLPFFNKKQYPSLLGKAFVCNEFIVMPLTHPSTLIHHPQYWDHTLKRYRRVFSLEPCRWFSSCPICRFTVSGQLEYHWTDRYCLTDNRACERFRQESLGIAHSEYLLPDGSFLSVEN